MSILLMTTSASASPLAYYFAQSAYALSCSSSASELLQRKLPSVPSCLVLDVRLPGLSGFELHSELTKANIHIPIIFMTAHGDIPMSVRAMKSGALDFITKPFRDQDMLEAVAAAINRDRDRLRCREGTARPAKKIR